MAPGFTADRKSQRALEQNPPGVGGDELHRGDVPDRQRGVSAGQCGGSGEPEIDLYDPRFRTPVPASVPVLVTSGGGSASAPPPPPPPPGPPPAAGSAFGGQMPVDDGGEDHWSEVGGHWSDRTDAPPSRPGRG